jgi:hypothetical protein
MTVQERFAADYGMPLELVQKLVRLANRAGLCNEHACNGSPHPFSGDKADKNANAELWNDEVNRITRQIADLVRPYGFTAVEYTGLGPTLKRGEQFVEVPY